MPTGFPKPLFGGYSAPCMPLGSPKPPVPVASVVTVTLPYSNQSPHFIECFHGGKKIWVGKMTVFGFEVDNASSTLVMKMPVKYANKRGSSEGARQELGKPAPEVRAASATTICDSLPARDFAAYRAPSWLDSTQGRRPLNRSVCALCRS